MQRHDVASTLSRRCINAMCLLESQWENFSALKDTYLEIEYFDLAQIQVHLSVLITYKFEKHPVKSQVTLR